MNGSESEELAHHPGSAKSTADAGVILAVWVESLDEKRICASGSTRLVTRDFAQWSTLSITVTHNRILTRVKIIILPST